MTRKRQVAWSKKHENFVLDSMVDDKLLPAQIFTRFKDTLPSLRTFNRRLIDDPEFREKVNACYEVIFDDLHVQLEEISMMSATKAILAYSDVTESDEVDFREAAEFKKSRIDTLKFSLAKLASVLSRKYNSKQLIEHTGQIENRQVFVLPDYVKQYQQGQVIDIDKDEA